MHVLRRTPLIFILVCAVQAPSLACCLFPALAQLCVLPLCTAPLARAGSVSKVSRCFRCFIMLPLLRLVYSCAVVLGCTPAQAASDDSRASSLLSAAHQHHLLASQSSQVSILTSQVGNMTVQGSAASATASQLVPHPCAVSSKVPCAPGQPQAIEQAAGAAPEAVAPALDDTASGTEPSGRANPQQDSNDQGTSELQPVVNGTLLPAGCGAVQHVEGAGCHLADPGQVEVAVLAMGGAVAGEQGAVAGAQDADVQGSGVEGSGGQGTGGIAGGGEAEAEAGTDAGAGVDAGAGAGTSAASAGDGVQAHESGGGAATSSRFSTPPHQRPPSLSDGGVGGSSQQWGRAGTVPGPSGTFPSQADGGDGGNGEGRGLRQTMSSDGGVAACGAAGATGGQRNRLSGDGLSVAPRTPSVSATVLRHGPSRLALVCTCARAPEVLLLLCAMQRASVVWLARHHYCRSSHDYRHASCCVVTVIPSLPYHTTSSLRHSRHYRQYHGPCITTHLLLVDAHR